jgi:hypothetical protein
VLFDGGSNFDYYGLGIQSFELLHSTGFNAFHTFKHTAVGGASNTESLRVGVSSTTMNSTNIYVGTTAVINAGDLLSVNGTVSVRGLNVTGAGALGVTTTNNLNVIGTSTLAGLMASGVSTLAGVTATGLTVTTGISTLAGLTASGVSTLAGVTATGLTVTTGISTLAGLTASGVSTLASLNVTGASNVTMPSAASVLIGTAAVLTAGDRLSVNGQMTASNDVRVGQNLTVIGTSALNNVVASGQLTVNNNIITSGYVAAWNTFGFKNRIINGDMRINQRAAVAATPANNTTYYSVDRMMVSKNGTGTLTAQQLSIAATVFTSPGNDQFQSVLRISIGTLSGTIASGDFYQLIGQRIEGLNVADLKWGTAGAQSVAVSFWWFTSVAAPTGTYTLAVRGGGGRSYVTPLTFSTQAAGTWQKISFVIPGDTSGTWTYDNTTALDVSVYTGVGTSLQTAPFGPWVATNSFANTGSNSLTAFTNTAGAHVQITGFQVEKGPLVTAFDFRSFTEEFRLCQRYYERWANFIREDFSAGANQYYCQTYAFKSPKRIAPGGGVPGTPQAVWITTDVTNHGPTNFVPYTNFNTTESFQHWMNIAAVGKYIANGTWVFDVEL